jgi:predicted AAA+ superfamily ATPase
VAEDAMAVEIVKLRLFAGLSVEEAAEALAGEVKETASTSAISTAEHLERKLARLRSALDALRPGSPSVSPATEAASD